MQLPSVAEYKSALRALVEDSPEAHQRMLEAHFLAKNHRITATELAKAAGYANYSAANLQYGKFCRRLCDALAFTPPIGNSGEQTFTYVLASASRASGSDWEWTMHAPVVEALSELKIDGDANINDSTSPVYPDEPQPNRKYLEGALSVVSVNAYERSSAARAACLEYWGATCAVCDMDFESIYGAISERCLHVHHLVPLHTVGEAYEVDPINDLRPVCPNCHGVLHTTEPSMSIAILRAHIRNARKG